MRVPTQPQKARRNSTLDQQLTPDQRDDLYNRLDKGMSYGKASEFLLETYGIKLSDSSIWHWASRRRRITSEPTFARLLETIRADKEQALALGREVGSAQELNDANVLLLSQALFECRRNDDLQGMTQVARLFTSVLSAVTQTRRAEISARTARTAQDRFEFDAAQAALMHQAELTRINADDSLDQRAKIARAIERLFGPELQEPPDPGAAPAPDPTPPPDSETASQQDPAPASQTDTTLALPPPSNPA